MSDAIDNAEVMLFGVSLACESLVMRLHFYLPPPILSEQPLNAECMCLSADKESGNCRLEANYAHQQVCTCSTKMASQSI